MLPILVLALQAFLWGDGTAAPSTKGSTGIVPKSKTKGVDFCGVDANSYLIRSDLGLYMRSSSFHEAKDIHIFTLHNSVRGGDHYLAHKKDLFYIIKDNEYRRVDNLNKDSKAVVYTLHANCRKGDHYFSSGDYFYIMFKSKGVIRRVTNMHEDTGAKTFPIHSSIKDGLYFWGTKDYVYCVKGSSKWGAEYQRTTDVEKYSNPVTYSFHPDCLNFIPGGIAVTYGKSYSMWHRVSLFINEASISVSREYSITIKVGYEKGKMTSMEHNWKVSVGASVGAGGLGKLLVEAQFSMEAAYGGSRADTSSETWSEATEVTDKMTFTLPPKKSVHVWQYKLGFGDQDILYSRSALAFTDTAVPPKMNPFEPPKN